MGLQEKGVRVLVVYGEGAGGLAAPPPEVAAALSAALDRLGYGRESWLGVCAADGGAGSRILMSVVTAVAPELVLAIDADGAESLRRALADRLDALEDRAAARLANGAVADLGCVRVISIGEFAEMLQDASAKQLAWAWLKRVPATGRNIG